MTQKRYLTKSRFKLACECPTKLFYTGNSEYANQKQANKFLKALAQGGFQVGELAKQYFPGGHDIKSPKHEQSLAETNELLTQDKVTIYEAAIQAGNLFIRADILVKDGNKLKLYEVKAKSYDSNVENPFAKAKWKPYLSDVAFQKHVLHLAFPDYEVSAHLMLVNKNAICPTDGLHQKFKLVKISKNKTEVEMTETLTEEELDSPILCKVNVDKECESIFNSVEDVGSNKSMSFKERVDLFAEHYASDTKISMPISTRCHSCEFYTTDSDSKSKLSGKKECWREQLGWDDKDFNEQTVLDVWKLNYLKKEKLIQEGRIKMSALTEEDVNPTPDEKAGYSMSQRQWLQIEKCQTNDETFWIDHEDLQKVMDSWLFPLHFIDFETIAAVIPFNAGRKPYEGITFQFSHHIVHKDGTVEHAGQYLNSERGVFPNYEFLRKIKAELDHDSGTIFRYSHHENSFLKTIYHQLRADKTVLDREELCKFIKTITESKKKEDEKWIGKRNMVDLCGIVMRHYYDPATNGSNSIKDVLPAILNSSQFLKDKYSKPIYGAPRGIKSLNFGGFQWVEFENGKVKDPYKLLPKLSSDEDESKLYFDDELNHGGAAMTAYARMQFTEMSKSECNEIRKALLKYCELDTMAMVMIYEGLNDLLSKE